jgi:aryl-alcohol dehydrogenase-like predicted oxidoreductase
MKYRKLGNTGLDVSILSFGASSLGSVFRDVQEEECLRTVHTAVDMGINLIDVSPYYGLTKAEVMLGKAIKQIPRDKFLLSTKAGRYGIDQFDFSAKRVTESLEESLQRLNTDYADMFFLHDIEFGSFQQVIEEGIPTLQKLKQEGKIRYYGVTALPLKAFEKTLSVTEVDLILSYCHYSLNDTTLLDLIPLLDKKQAGLISASPLSMGLLNGRDSAAWHPASNEIKQACKKAAEHCASQGADLAKLAVQYSVNNELIPTTLVSTASPVNIQKNMEWTEEPMDMELLKEVLDILQPIHNMTWSSGHLEYQ